MSSEELSPLMRRLVDRAREGGIEVEVSPGETGTTVVFQEGGPYPGWLMVYVVQRSGRWSHTASRALVPSSRPHTIRVQDIAVTVSSFIEAQARREANKRS